MGVEQIVALVVVNTADRTIHRVNGLANEMLGYDEGELTGQSLDVILPEWARDAHALYEQAYMRNPRPRRMGAVQDISVLPKSGDEFEVWIGLAPQTDEEHERDKVEGLVTAAILPLDGDPRRKMALRAK